jgi:2-polyprenyl-6-methoxyphenol hydroxylase-like FAD-dependent oxidoreductase
MGTAAGRVLGRITGQDVLLLGRVSLRDLLLDALPARVSWDDSRVQDVTALPGDLIVGADGARSVVRSTYWGNSAHPAHVTVVRGVLDEDRSTGILEEFWGDGGVFGLTPLPAAVGAPGPARTNWFAAFREHRFASTEDALGHVRHLAAPFPQRVQDAMRAAAPEQTKVNGISVSPATRSFVRGRAVLIGDAAHAMTPNGGHGATEAIQDGAVLGEFIGRWGLREGGARYGRRRVVLPQVIRLGSSVITQLALARGGAARARDLLARR